MIIFKDSSNDGCFLASILGRTYLYDKGEICMKKILLTGLFAFLLCPMANAQTYLGSWNNGIEIDENKAYSLETRDSGRVLVQYEFPSLTATGKELTLNPEFNYSLVNSYGLAIYDYKEDRTETNSEVTVNMSSDITTYDANFTPISTKTLSLGSYSYPKGDEFQAKRKAKKNKEKFLHSLQTMNLRR
jgi:hypothetical protein